MCDRCGLECGDDHRLEVSATYMSISRRDSDSWLQKREREMDLCDRCTEAFDHFMDTRPSS